MVSAQALSTGGVEAIVSLNAYRRFELSFDMHKPVLVNSLKGSDMEIVEKAIRAVFEERAKAPVVR